MTKKIHITMITAMMAVSALLTTGLSSCEYKDLDDGSELNAVTINFDMESKIDSVPGSMRVAFYPVDALAKANMNKADNGATSCWYIRCGGMEQ